MVESVECQGGAAAEITNIDKTGNGDAAHRTCFKSDVRPLSNTSSSSEGGRDNGIDGHNFPSNQQVYDDRRGVPCTEHATRSIVTKDTKQRRFSAPVGCHLYGGRASLYDNELGRNSLFTSYESESIFSPSNHNESKKYSRFSKGALQSGAIELNKDFDKDTLLTSPDPRVKKGTNSIELKGGESHSTDITSSQHTNRRILKKKFVKVSASIIPQKVATRPEPCRNSCGSELENDFANMACYFIRTSSSLDERQRRINALKSIRTNARQGWSELTETEKGVKIYVLAAFLSVELPRSMAAPYDWIKNPSLLDDRDVVLAILRYDTSFSVLDGRFCVPARLRSDKEVMVEFISKRNGRLTLVHESLLNDKDVILAAVSQNGQDLQYASEAMRTDKQIVEAACQVFGNSFQFSLGETRRKLGSDPVFMTKVIESFKGGPMLEFASNEIQRDPVFVCKALVNGYDFSLLPAEQRSDQAFLLSMVTHDCAVYTKFPITLKRSRIFSMLAILNCKDTTGAADTSKQKEVVTDVCQHANFLLREESTSRRLLTATPVMVAQELLRQGSRFIEKNLVLTAVRHNAFLYGEHLQEPFRSDLDVITAAITSESASHVLRFVPRWTLLNHPKLVILAIEACNSSKVDSQRDSLAAVGLLPWEIFRNRPVTAAWARAGFPLTPSFPTDFANDEEICLLFLANLQNIWRHRLRKWISTYLKGSKSFMIKACAHDASFFIEGTNGLSQDYNVLLVAASVDFDQVVRTMTEQGEHAGLRLFCEQAQDRLRACEGFKIVSLGIIKQDGARGVHESDGGSPLSLLDQGHETREALLELIGQHLDLPPGDEIQRLESIRFTVRHLLRTLHKA